MRNLPGRLRSQPAPETHFDRHQQTGLCSSGDDENDRSDVQSDLCQSLAAKVSIKGSHADGHGTTLEVVAMFCLAVSITLALAALYLSFFTPAPLTASRTPSASAAAVAFFVATWLPPLHYIVF